MRCGGAKSRSRMRAVGQVVDLIQPRNLGHQGSPADVDEDVWRRQRLVVDGYAVRPREARVALVHRAPGIVLQPALDAAAGLAGDRVLARLHLLHVHHRAALDYHAVLGGATRGLRGISAGHQRLGRRAAGVDAGAAKAVALDHRHTPASLGQAVGKRRPGLAGADDDSVEFAHWVSSVLFALSPPCGPRPDPISAVSATEPRSPPARCLRPRRSGGG